MREQFEIQSKSTDSSLIGEKLFQDTSTQKSEVNEGSINAMRLARQNIDCFRLGKAPIESKVKDIESVNDRTYRPGSNKERVGKIKVNGVETSVRELRQLAGRAGSYDAKKGVHEHSMIVTNDGKKFQSPSAYLGSDPAGNKVFLSTALLKMYMNKFPHFMFSGKSHGVALEVHTHQSHIPGTDPYVFSDPDISLGVGKTWPQIVATDDGCFMFKQRGSKSRIPEGYFDSKGGFHRTIKNTDGTYSTESRCSSPDKVKCLPR